MKNYNFRIIIEQDEEGMYVAKCPALSGCHTQAKTYEQVVLRMQEAISLYLEVLRKRRQTRKLDNITQPKFFALQDLSLSV